MEKREVITYNMSQELIQTVVPDSKKITSLSLSETCIHGLPQNCGISSASLGHNELKWPLSKTGASVRDISLSPTNLVN